MRRIRDQHQVREILFQRGPGESGEVDVAEEVAVHREEGPIAEQGKRLCDSPRGLERLGFARIADRDAEAASIAERRFDHMTKMSVVDHDLANARARECLDQPDDQGLAAHFEEHLWDRVGEGPHAFAAPGGKNHGFHWSKSEVVADALFLRLEILQEAPEREKKALPNARPPHVAHHDPLALPITLHYLHA